MRRNSIVIVSFATIVSMASHSWAEPLNEEFCSDDVCKNLEDKYFKKEYEEVVATADPKAHYSEGALFYIGMSYIILADKEPSLERKERLYRQAISLKYYPAYMSLYNIYREKDPKIAAELLREYSKTNPSDPALFVVLGDIEFNRGAYKDADKYLKRARKLSTSHRSEIDWLLFKTNYLLGNYRFAANMFESALAQSQLTDEILAIRSDPKFAGIENRPEFRQYKTLLRRQDNGKSMGSD